MLAGIESGTRKILGYVGLFLLLTFVSGIVIGIANSNLIWGEGNQYGRVDIPGHKVIRLPSGRTQVNVAVALPGRGNATPDLLLPAHTSITVDPVDGGPDVDITQSLGSSENADDKYDDTQRRVWYIHVPETGDYTVTAGGNFTGYGVNAELWLGREPAPINGWDIWLLALGVAAIGELAFVGVATWRSKRKNPASGYQEDGEGGPTNSWVPPA